MAEKWDESANDSPEVVYEGFSPPATTHSQGMITASSSFVTTDGSTATYMATPTVMENQGEGSHHEEVDRARLCFVCCNPVSDKNFESVKTSMNHSHAPLLVLLTDVLGYKLEEGRLHSQVVCKACYHLLDIIDELQQTLTESKTDVRTKFLETVQKLKLKYPRTDKMLKPRCLRCIQMSQSSARKRGRGRGWKGRVEDGMRGRGRGRGGRGRGRQSNDGSDNDGEGQGVCEGEICKDVLPSKSLHQSSSQGELKKFGQSGKVLPFVPRDLPIYTDCSCVDMDPTSYECLMCRKSDTEVFYQYCESCLTCQGTFVPWGVNVTLRYVGDQCSITQINAQSYFDEELLCILTNGLKCYKPMAITEFEYDDDDDNRGKRNEAEVKAVDAPKNIDKSPNKKSKVRIRTDKDDDDDERGKDHAKPNKDDDKSAKDCNESTKDTDKSAENNATARRNMEEICADNTTTNTKRHVKEETISVKKEMISDGSEEEPEYFMGGVTTGSDSDTDQDIDEGTSSSLKQELAKDTFSDIGMNVCKPLLKIQKSRRIKEIPSKHKRHPHKTLCDEFESILSRPSLGKRKIKPTEKVKWLTESCNARRKDTQSVLENKELKGKRNKNDQNDSITVSKDNKQSEGVKNSKESPEKNSEIIEVSPGKRKRKLTEKAKDFMYNLNADCTKVCPITKGESVKVTVVKGKKTDEKDPEDEQEEEVNDVEETVNSHKEEINDKEAANDDEEKDKESEREDGEEKIVVKPEVVIKKSPGGFSRRGRGPGRRKRRSNTKFKYMWDNDFEQEGLIVKTEDGKEIDLSQLSLKNLQNDKMYRCPVCGKEYKSQGGMQYHLATHTSSARYSCSLCSYRTIRHGDLKKHFVIHTGLKPYKCEVCGQEFSTSSSYKRHMRIHSGEKPYKCEVCGKDFRNITTRKQHMILHTGIKNFVCEVCGKSFALKHHYTSHRKRHNGEMPFKCFHCDSAFKTHNAVKTHRKKEHPVEEAERIQQNRLRRKRAVKDEKVIKLEDDTSPLHQVFQAPGDVLEQAMAATVETVDGVHYEYVDVADPSIPLVSKMIKENWNGRDSVVLTITHIEEEEYEVDEDVM